MMLIACFLKAKTGAQTLKKAYPAYSLQEDRPWIDSLRSVIRKGEPREPRGTSYKLYWKKELRFLKSCQTLGLYYERLYDKGKLKNMSKALFYYNKIADLGNFSDYDTGVYKASALRTTLYRKLEDIYFKGKGVKKDREKSFYYALSGMTDGRMFKFYSERYFHCNCLLLNATSGFNYEKGFNFEFKANPFASVTTIFMKAPMKAEIRKITDAFLKRYAPENLVLVITANSWASARGQAKSAHLLENIKGLILHYTTIPDSIIFTNNVVDGEGPSLEISFMTLKEFEAAP